MSSAPVETASAVRYTGRRAMLLVAPLAIGAVAVAVTAALQEQPWLVLGLAAALAAAVCIARRPVLATFLFFAILYSNAATVAVQVHGLPFPVAAGVAVLLGVPLYRHVVLGHGGFVIDRVFLLMLVFAVLQIVGVTIAVDPVRSMQRVVTHLLEGLCLYALVLNAVRTTTELRTTVFAFLAAGVLMGSVPLWQQMTGTQDHSYGGFGQRSAGEFKAEVTNSPSAQMQARFSGSLDEYNRFALVMLALVPAALIVAQSGRSRVERWLALAAVPVIVGGGAMAFSRGAAVGLAAILLLMLAMRLLSLVHVGLFAVGLVALVIAVPGLGTRIAKLEGLWTMMSGETAVGQPRPDSSLRNRSHELQSAWIIFKQHPILGVGPGMYREHHPDSIAWIGGTVRAVPRQPHNLYLGLAANHGILGLGCFLAIIGVTMRGLMRVRRRWRDADPELANLAAIFLLALVAHLVCGIALHLSYERYLWVIVALSGATVLISETRARTVHEPIAEP
ncbi:MAG: O-antigen ligase family protein [Planctomycetes bacterium]|nr:O-antigen ligase family protein [Planctomycetota bacterium]